MKEYKVLLERSKMSELSDEMNSLAADGWTFTSMSNSDNDVIVIMERDVVDSTTDQHVTFPEED